jgi:hypothetical protein
LIIQVLKFVFFSAKFRELIYFSVNQFEKRLINQFTITQTTAAATAKTITYSRSGTRRPIDAPQSEQNFG